MSTAPQNTDALWTGNVWRWRSPGQSEHWERFKFGAGASPVPSLSGTCKEAGMSSLTLAYLVFALLKSLGI